MFAIGNEPLHGNCSVAQLTKIGFVQQLSNGKVMKKAYIDSGFLSDQLNEKELYIRSDSKLSSIQLILLITAVFV